VRQSTQRQTHVKRLETKRRRLAKGTLRWPRASPAQSKKFHEKPAAKSPGK
jgi:hypothetical protein